MQSFVVSFNKPFPSSDVRWRRGIRTKKISCIVEPNYDPKLNKERNGDGTQGKESKMSSEKSGLQEITKVQKIIKKGIMSASANPKIRHSGLKGNPLSSGVKNATSRFELPPPHIAARNLVEQAQFAHLCTVMSNKHHKRAGYPFGTIVDFAVDGAGYPIISVLSLAVPTRNVLEDPRCSLVVQMPGWSGLANARLTIFGDVFQLPDYMAQHAQNLFRSPSMKQKIVSGNTLFFRMHNIKDIYFVGGFGTVQWIEVSDYVNSQPDEIVMSMEIEMFQSLNEMYGEDLRMLFSEGEILVDEATIISVDALGADIRLRCGTEFYVVRFGFDSKITTVTQIRSALTAAFAA